MNPTDTGSFGAAAEGMTPELQAAVQRRAGGNPSGPMGQVSNSAPTANPSTQMPPSSPAPTPTAMPATPQSSMGGSASLPGGTDEATLIVKALTGRLQALSKIQGV